MQCRQSECACLICFNLQINVVEWRNGCKCKKPGVRGMESMVLRSDLGAGCGVEKGEETAR